jgi:ribosomal protein S18 acetylase RimI-like enzyme
MSAAIAQRIRGRLGFRPVTDADEDLLYRIYVSTRTAELAEVPWNEAQKDALLRMQFHAQHVHYQRHYRDAEFLLVLRDDQPIGRMYLARRPGELRLVDIALLPEHRGAGVGSYLMRELIAEAEDSGAVVTMHLEAQNPALRLCQRLGFRVRQQKGMYLFLERRPTA